MKRIISLLSAALLVAGSKAADIRGYVVDAETGEALAASNVFVKGTTAGTTADVRGYFEINVADGTELTAAYVGYTPSSFTAKSGNKAIEVRLGAARRQCLRFAHKLRRAVVADVGSDFVSHTNQAITYGDGRG